MAVTQAYILCGGFGTRLGSMVKDTPKPMLPVGGKPILQHTIELLKEQGFTKVFLVAGYKADVVEEFFGKLDWGIDIEVHTEPELVGTAGYMPQLRDRLDEDFLLLYGDVFIDFDVRKQCAEHEKHDAVITFLTGPSTHPWDSNLIQTDKEGNVTEFIGKEKTEGKPYKNIGDRAVYVVNKKVIDYIPKGKSDFMKNVFPAALAEGEKLKVYTLPSGEFVRDMGKPERFPIVEEYLKVREEIKETRANPGPITTVFLDRDGVLNEEVNLLARPDQLRILPGVPQAIKIFNDREIKTIVITNQPVIARGLCTESTLELIHNSLKRSIETEGGRLDAIYHCPHHPETQYDEGVKELRKGCDCRKPGIGMLLKAKKEHGIDLKGAIMIGDSFRDIEAGKNAGLRTIFIDSGNGAVKEGMQPDYTFPSLIEAAKAIALGKVN